MRAAFGCGCESRRVSVRQRQRQFGLYDRALVVDLHSALENRGGCGWVPAELQRPPEVIEGVGVGQTCSADRL